MASLEQDIKDIKEKLEILCSHLGIDKRRPADVIELRDRAKRKAEKLVSQKTRTR